MKYVQKLSQIKHAYFKLGCALSVLLTCHPVFAEGEGNADVIGDFMTNSLKGLFGSNAGFWKMFILADIGLATLASMKTKSPLVFVGVFMTALVPGFLVKHYVFKTA